jgi:hypothetical protein
MRDTVAEKKEGEEERRRQAVYAEKMDEESGKRKEEQESERRRTSGRESRWVSDSWLMWVCLVGLTQDWMVYARRGRGDAKTA